MGLFRRRAKEPTIPAHENWEQLAINFRMISNTITGLEKGWLNPLTEDSVDDHMAHFITQLVDIDHRTPELSQWTLEELWVDWIDDARIDALNRTKKSDRYLYEQPFARAVKEITRHTVDVLNDLPDDAVHADLAVWTRFGKRYSGRYGHLFE
ncbi:MAG: hypothetical protein AAF567_06975 [Actinomycetota bacterium]